MAAASTSSRSSSSTASSPRRRRCRFPQTSDGAHIVVDERIGGENHRRAVDGDSGFAIWPLASSTRPRTQSSPRRSTQCVRDRGPLGASPEIRETPRRARPTGSCRHKAEAARQPRKTAPTVLLVSRATDWAVQRAPVVSIKSARSRRWGVASRITVSHSRSSIIVRPLPAWSVITGRRARTSDATRIDDVRIEPVSAWSRVGNAALNNRLC